MKTRYVDVLVKYIPRQSADLVADWIVNFGIHLNITKDRATKLGDFRPSRKARGHKITINHNLNPYSFLLTLVHEIAHLETWNKYKNQVLPHGKEWKEAFSRLMRPFLNESVFPEEVLVVINSYLANPKASSCSDENLMRALKRFDQKPSIFLEDIPPDTIFRLQTGRVFRKGKQRRKHFECMELKTNRLYLINPLAEVELI